MQALLRLRPELHDTPCVVMDGDPPLQQVCSLNKRARLLGMSRGMTRVEVDTFPLVRVLLRSHKEEATAKRVLLESVGTFSPRVENRNENGAFHCVVDIVGTEKLFGPPEALAREILASTKALGVTACVAISRNFHAATVLAKGLSPRTSLKIIPAGEEAAALAPLALSVLDLTEEHLEVFCSAL
jgi:protein ImuB